jgi:tetratricopeptide (TPR) repeat protein
MDRSWIRHFVLVSAGIAGAVCAVQGIYMQVEARQVPVERLVANLEKAAKANPSDVQTRINLARLHAMAFALKSDTFPASVDKNGVEQPWFGNEPQPTPRRDRPAPTPAAEASARAHLEKSIATYEEALKLSPENRLALLGYGWVQQQSGDTTRAIEQYRRVIAVAWPSEKDIKGKFPGQIVYVYEAAGYLIPLLNRDRDAAEIADLQAKRTGFENLPRAITPIAVPLTDNVPVDRLHDSLAQVRFDADGSGLDREWTWITPDAGWLVFDRDGRGQITSALQLFGNVTFWLFWANGYEALAALDDDGSGRVEGGELKHIAIWRDLDGDGVSDAGEVQPLSAHGITALSYASEPGDGVELEAVSAKGAQFVDGTTRPTYDIILRSSARIRTLPE